MKEYSRPAAGQPPPQARDIRSPDTLLACLRYLLTDVLRLGLEDSDMSDQTVYDFLFDRLRAVRQDLTLQNVADSVTLTVLASCVRQSEATSLSYVQTLCSDWFRSCCCYASSLMP